MKEINSETKSKKYALPFYWMSGTAFCLLMVQQASGQYMKVIIQTLCFILAIGVTLFFNRRRLDIRYCRIRDKRDTGYYVFAAVLLAIAVPFFHKIWKDQAPRLSFLENYGVSADFILAMIPYVLAICAFPAVACGLKYVLRDYLDIRNNVWEENRHLGKSAAILAGIYCFAIIAIIRADYIYKDDMQRLVWGSTVYGRESRFVGEFATFFLHFDEFFADTSPLPQITEMLIMAVSVMIVYAALTTDKRKPRFYDYAAMVPFALSPYFLECISFKYDSPQHALAMLFSVFPLLYWRGDRKKYMLASAICMPLMCMSHQVLMAFYPSMVVLLCTLSLLREEWKLRDAAVFAGESALAYIVGVGIYKFGILRVMPKDTGYTSSELLGIKELIPGVLKNYKTFFQYVLDDFNLVWLGLIGILCISFIVLLVKNSEIKKTRAIAYAVVCFVILLALSNSIYPLLYHTQYSPRHIYSFGLFVGLISLTCATHLGDKDVVPRASIILLACAFIVFAFVYGNALEEQKTYTSYRVEMVLDTLTEITSENPDTTYHVQINGTTGYSPAIDAMPESLYMVKRLVTTSFSEYFGTWWAEGICEYYGLNIECRNVAEEADYTELDLPLIEKNYYHAIYADDEHILIVLEDR